MSLEREVWQRLLDADMNARFWGHMARRYQGIEKGALVAVAVLSSATVATWVADLYPGAFKLLSILTAFVSVALPILNIARDVECMVELRVKWAGIRNQYQQLYDRALSLDEESIRAQLEQLSQRELDLEPLETRLPRSRKLVDASYLEVCRSRGLQPPGE